MAAPKNYISTGISKNLLTPCRRIGLSRTKKTPKNDNNPSPLTTTPKLEVTSTPHKSSKPDAETHKKKCDLDETPKKLPTPTKIKKNFAKTIINEKTNKHEAVQEHNEKTKANKTAQDIDKTALPIDKNTLKDTLTKSPDQNCAEKTLVTAEIHHPVAKRNINFSQFDTPSVVQKQAQKISKNDSSQMDDDQASTLNHTLENSELRVRKRKMVLEDDDFVISENLADSGNCSKITNNKKVRTKSSQSQEKSSTKEKNSQSHKKTTFEDTLAVDKVNFNRSSKQKTGDMNSFTSKCLKDDTTASKENNSVITLGRFTTEDYLREYSSNPEIFQENLDKDSSDDDFVPFKSFPNKLKQDNNDKFDVKSPSTEKSYVGIVCPLISVDSNNQKPKNSLSTQKLSEKSNSKTTLKDCESKLKQKLAVSLERLNPGDLKRKIINEDDGPYQKVLPCTPEIATAKTASPIINFCDDDDDNELFTSSPQDEKHQQENLLKLILDIENKIKQKEEKLEKLKQAQVYKKIHSPEKLKVSSDRWFEGCRSSLKDLLIKMQEHGPMEMDVLIRNLRIPANIIERLKL